MRVLVLCHGLWYGGAQVSTFEFLKLIKDNLSVHVVVCSDANPDFVCDIEALGLSVSRTPYRMIKNYPVMDVEAVASLVKDADVVWISDVEYLAAPKIKRIKNVPVVAHLRSYALVCPWWGASYGLREICLQPCGMQRIIRCKQMFNEGLRKVGVMPRWRSGLYKILDVGKGPADYLRWPLRNRDIINYFDGFIAVSKAVREIHQNHIPQFKDKPCEIVYNPFIISHELVKTSVENAGDNSLKITFVDPAGGQLTKGPHIFLQAMKLLVNKGADFDINMVGCRGTWVEKYAYRLGIAERITFYSRLSTRNELHKLMSYSSVVVVPSVWPEPFGRVALEANYLGVPVVASRIGGLTEVIEDGITGFTVEPNNPKSLADGITKALTTSFSREKIQVTTISKFNNNLIKNRFLQFLEVFGR
jgi:glycosyltransferase involved in cell wall biosynthesis